MEKKQTNLDKIVHLTFLNKAGVPRDRYIYLVGELEEGQNTIVNIAGKEVRLVVPDEHTACLLTVEPDEEVRLGKYLTYVDDVFTEEQLLENQAKQDDYYASLGMGVTESSDNKVNNGSYFLSKPN